MVPRGSKVRGGPKIIDGDCRKLRKLSSFVHSQTPQIGNSIMLFRIIHLPDAAKSLQSRVCIGEGTLAGSDAIDEMTDFKLCLFAFCLVFLQQTLFGHYLEIISQTGADSAPGSTVITDSTVLKLLLRIAKRLVHQNMFVMSGKEYAAASHQTQSDFFYPEFLLIL